MAAENPNQIQSEFPWQFVEGPNGQQYSGDVPEQAEPPEQPLVFEDEPCVESMQPVSEKPDLVKKYFDGEY